MVDSDTHCIDVLTQVSAATKELQSVAAAESVSRHPIARSIVEAAAGHPAAIGFQTTDGLSASAIVEGHRAVVGRRQFLVQHGQRAGIQMPSRSAGTLVAVGWDCAIWGFVTLGDSVKESSATAIAELEAQGRRSVLLTGDSAAVVASVAHEVGTTDVNSEVLPARKVRVVEDSKAGAHRVAMVGHGLNDAAALATADLGIAMSNGADAGQSAQVISPYP